MVDPSDKSGQRAVNSEEAGWTTQTLKVHLESMILRLERLGDERDLRYSQRFDSSQIGLTTAMTAAEKAVQAALAAAEKAVVKAENASEKRFEGVNEFRLTLSDQARDLMPRKEAEARMAAIEERVTMIGKQNAESRGAHLGNTQVWGYISLAGGLILMLVSLLGQFFKRLGP